MFEYLLTLTLSGETLSQSDSSDELKHSSDLSVSAPPHVSRRQVSFSSLRASSCGVVSGIRQVEKNKPFRSSPSRLTGGGGGEILRIRCWDLSLVSVLENQSWDWVWQRSYSTRVCKHYTATHRSDCCHIFNLRLLRHMLTSHSQTLKLSNPDTLPTFSLDIQHFSCRFVFKLGKAIVSNRGGSRKIFMGGQSTKTTK